MPDLRQQLQACLQGRVCLMGLGNVDLGDDGFGVKLAGELAVSSPLPSGSAGAMQFRNMQSNRRDAKDAEKQSRNERESGRDTETRRREDAEIGLRSRRTDFLQPASMSVPEIIVAGTTPERFLGQVAEQGFEHLIFLDAVEFGAAPGAAIFLNSTEMAARFPQISTHKLSLGLLAKWVESSGQTKVWLLGVQPESLRPGHALTPTVYQTLEVLRQLLVESWAATLGRNCGSRHEPTGIEERAAGPQPAQAANLPHPMEVLC